MKHFRPSPGMTGVFAILALGFVLLGNWQLHRAAEKDLRIQRFESAQELAELPGGDSVSEFSEISLLGQFDPQRHILADNQVLNGRTGVHVYSLFYTDHDETILVNRGWKPLPADRSLPEIETESGTIEIFGRLGPIPAPGRRLGPDDTLDPELWPQLLTYPDVTAIQQAVSENIYPLVLFLDESSTSGFEGRDWKPVFMTPGQHQAYAFQWFALALTCVLAWLFLGYRRSTIR